MAHSSIAGQSVKSKEDENSSNPVPEWIMAREGIKLIINDKGPEAEKLFLEYPNSLVMYAGYAFAVMIDALMSFEEDKLNKALFTLREVERRCSSEDGWLKTVTNKVFGVGPANSENYAEQLETQIILADSQVCIATLTFLQQDITGYFKGGWVLRRAWKIYQRLYKEIFDLYEEIVGELHLSSLADGSTTKEEIAAISPIPNIDWDIPEHITNGYIQNSIPHSKSAHVNLCTSQTTNDSNGNSNKIFLEFSTKYSNPKKQSLSEHSKLSNCTNSSHWNRRSNPLSNSFSLMNISSIIYSPDKTKEKNITKEAIIRLMGAVSFGYGLFQLGVSLLPPNMIRLIKFLGFSTNRENGLTCLMYSRIGTDMRAPLATLSLLWYHTIVRPFYAIDGTNVQAGVETTLKLLKESESEFGQSSLFLFYYGRAYRLNSNIKKALTSFQQAMKHSCQREMKILCLHEIGWCYLIELEYCQAKNAFINLKSSSRWSKAFYCYLSAICSGACENFLPQNIFEELKSLSERIPKGIQLDDFLNKRAKRCPPGYEAAKRKNPIFWKLLVFEMLYLWNALPSCSTENISIIISECSQLVRECDEPMLGLSKLILGCANNINKEYDNAIKSLRECLNLRKNVYKSSDDMHITAFAQYELGALLLRNEETKQEGKLLLQQIGQYSQYDFDQKLDVRIHHLTKHFN